MNGTAYRHPISNGMELDSLHSTALRYRRNTRAELTELYKLYVMVFNKSAQVRDEDIFENDATEIASAMAVVDRHNKHPRSIEFFYDAMRRHGFMANLSVMDYPRRRVRARS